MPQLYNARRLGVDIAQWPIVAGIEPRCSELTALDAAHPDRTGWARQPSPSAPHRGIVERDTPRYAFTVAFDLGKNTGRMDIASYAFQRFEFMTGTGGNQLMDPPGCCFCQSRH